MWSQLLVRYHSRSNFLQFLLFGYSESCITEHLNNSMKCPLCSVSIEKEFLFPNLACNALRFYFNLFLFTFAMVVQSLQQELGTGRYLLTSLNSL